MVKVSQAELIEGAIAGEVVSFPTDTVPALASKPETAEQIFRLKQRPQHKPLILMGATVTDLLSYVTYTPQELEIWQEVINKYLPGALTLVLPASAKVPPGINPTQSKTVGIRIPDHTVAREILAQTGVLATSSANVSGQAALTTMEAISQEFPDILVLDNFNSDPDNQVSSGLPSTVIRWQGQEQAQPWEMLRQGIVTIRAAN